MHIPNFTSTSWKCLPDNSTLVAHLVSEILKTWPNYEEALVGLTETFDDDESELGFLIMAALRRVQALLALFGLESCDHIEFIAGLKKSEILDDFAMALAKTPLRILEKRKIKIDVDLFSAQLKHVGIELDVVIGAQLAMTEVTVSSGGSVVMPLCRH